MTTIREELEQLARDANVVLGRQQDPAAVGSLHVQRAVAGWSLVETISISGATRPALPGYHTQAALAQQIRAFVAGAKAMRNERATA